MTTSYLTINDTELSVCTPDEGITSLARVLVALRSMRQDRLRGVSVNFADGPGVTVILTDHTQSEARDLAVALGLGDTPDHFAQLSGDLAVFGFATGASNLGGVSLLWAHEPIVPGYGYSTRHS